MLPNTLPGTGGTPVKIEITERQPFSDQQMRLVKGRFPVATPAPSTKTSTGMPVITQPGAKPIIVNPSTGKPIAGQSGDGTAASQLRQSAPKLPMIQVVMSTQTAATFGLHAGSTFEMVGPERASTGKAAKVDILVTGIVAPVDPTSTFWTADPSHRRPRPPGAAAPVRTGRARSWSRRARPRNSRSTSARPA